MDWFLGTWLIWIILTKGRLYPMRIYGSVQICFWENADTQQLSDQGKLFAIYLLTGPHSNMIGSFRLPDGYITEDLRWNTQSVKKAFQELENIKFLTRDQENGWLVVHDFLKWNPIQNPKQGIGIQKLFDVIPAQSIVLKPLLNSLLTYGKYLNQAFTERLQQLNQSILTVFENYPADKDKNQEQDQEQKKISMYKSSDLNDDHLAAQKSSVHFKSQAIDVLNFLNEKTGRIYRPVDTNLKLIIARLKSGASVSDCYQVIAKKTREWKGDSKMSEYLRPATLFNATKFEQYVGELIVSTHEESTNGF